MARELFPDVLRYVVGTPARYGFTGRTLADNAPETMLSLVVELRQQRARLPINPFPVGVDWPADFIWHTAVSPGSPDTIGV